MFDKLFNRKGVDKKRSTDAISDEDMLKYTGKTKAQLEVWAKDRPDVGGNQLAGKIGMGSASFAGSDSWAPLGKQKLKFPPQSQESKKMLDEDE